MVIGAGQAGLATSYHLKRLAVGHVVLDANPAAGGAWQHRWDSLRMTDVHGVADLPDAEAPEHSRAPANEVVPGYFADYEEQHGLPVLRPVRVDRVRSEDGILVVHARDRRRDPARRQQWRTRTVVNATGTWTRPFVPFYPGIRDFAGEQFHTANFPGVDHLRGKRVLVVGGGASAVQFIGELAPVAETIWVTRRPPVWRTDEFAPEAGLEAVTRVQERVVQGLPPESVVSVTGLVLRPQEQRAAELGAYQRRRPMFERIERDGVRWADGSVERVDVILWATGFRAAVDHLTPLGLRSPHGGIALEPVRGNVQGAVTSVVDPRVQLVGYGPSASTIGAGRAGRQAAVAVRRVLDGQL